jgi:hypothetical protein
MQLDYLDIYVKVMLQYVCKEENSGSNPENINSTPYNSWFIQLEGGVAVDLLDASAYERHCAERV